MELQNPESKIAVNSGAKNWEFQQRPQPMPMRQPLSGKAVESKSEGEDKNKTLTVKIFEVLMSVSFGALFFGLPLFFLNSTFQGIAFEKQIYFYFWVLVALISWITKSIVTGELKIKETPLDYFIGAFAVVYLLASIFSVDRWHSLFGFFGDQSRGFINVLACILVYYFILSNFTKKRLIIALSGIIASAALVEIWTFIGLFFATKLPTWIASHVPVSLFGSVTSLGLFFSLVYPLFLVAIYKLLESNLSKQWKIVLAGLTGFFLVLDIVLMWFLFSFIFLPNVFPGLIVGVSFFVIFVIALIVRPKSGWSWITFFAFMAVMLLLMIGGGDGYLPSKLPTEISPAYSLSWGIARDALKDKFLLGTGAASYGYDFSKYHSQDLNSTQFYSLRFYQGSGLLFETLPTIGFLGTVVAVLMLLAYLGTSVYLLSRDKEKNKMYSLGFFSSALIFLYSALVMRVDGSILIFGLLLAIISLAALQLESDNEQRFKTLSLKASPKYALALAFIFMLASGGIAYVFVFMGKSLVADIYMKKATTTAAHTEDDSVKKMVQAINLYPNEARYYSRAGQEYMVLANNEALKGKDEQNVTAIQQYLSNAIFLSNKAKDLAPNDIATVEGLAQVYENSVMFVDKSSDLAEQYYQRALELEPHNPVYYIKLGEMKIAKASTTQDAAAKKQLVQDSIDLFQKSVDEKKDYAVGYYYISVASQANGDLDKAIEASKNAIVNEQGNVNYVFMLANLFRQRATGEDLTQAEQIYKNIIGKDDSQYNVHLALGLLYEKEKKNDQAIAEYKKVLSLLSTDGGDDAKAQVGKMITNVQNGTGNLTNPATTAKTEPAAASAPTQSPAPTPTAPAITTPPVAPVKN